MADSILPVVKTCPRCDEEKPVGDFHRNGATRDGLERRCKACTLARQREYRSRNAAKVREWGRENMRRRRAADPEGTSAYMREWRRDNPDLVAAARAAWEEANYERMREYANRANRKWKSLNADKVREYNERWAAENPDKRAATAKRWREANPEWVRERKSRRRAIIRGATIGEIDLAALWDAQRASCGLCFEDIDQALTWPDPMSASVDHIVPLSKGGTHEQSNLQWTHLVCNLKKGARTP